MSHNPLGRVTTTWQQQRTVMGLKVKKLNSFSAMAVQNGPLQKYLSIKYSISPS
jgi:hypothetical protein